MRSSPVTLSARYVFPVEGPPIEHGCLTIHHGRIDWVGPAGKRAPDLDLGNVAITPGFVNAHTHLELAPLDDEKGPAVEDPVEWLGRVVAHRRSRPVDALRAAVGRNLEECARAGTTTLADITTAGLSWPQVAAAPVRAVVFAELIGLTRSR